RRRARVQALEDRRRVAGGGEAVARHLVGEERQLGLELAAGRGGADPREAPPRGGPAAAAPRPAGPRDETGARAADVARGEAGGGGGGGGGGEPVGAGVGRERPHLRGEDRLHRLRPSGEREKEEARAGDVRRERRLGGSRQPLEEGEEPRRALEVAELAVRV